MERIQKKFVDINNSLDKADREMRSVESLGGYVFNKVIGPKKEKTYTTESREVIYEKIVSSIFDVIVAHLS